MGHQIAYRHQFVRQRIGEFELRQILPHGIIPTEPPFVVEDGQCSGGEGLGCGSDGENGLGGDGVGTAQFLDSVAFLVDDAIALDDRNRASWRLPCLQGCFGE